mgnify:CR=1 FL=1
MNLVSWLGDLLRGRRRIIRPGAANIWTGRYWPQFRADIAVETFTGWCYAAAMLNAQAAASVPLRLYVRKEAKTPLFRVRPARKRTKAYLAGDLPDMPSKAAMRGAADMGDYVEVVERHPLTTLLHEANETANGYDTAVLRHVYLQLTGNAYHVPIYDREDDPPVEWWLLPSQWTWIVPDPTHEHLISGYLYGRLATQQVTFDRDEVIHFRYPNPKSLYYGMGKVEAGWPIISQNTAVHEADWSFYANSARPDYSVLFESGTPASELDRFDAIVAEKFQGTTNSGRFLSIAGAKDIKPLAWPPKDIQGREAIVEEIASVFGVPISKLKANDPNRANAETGDAGWMRDTILAMLRLDEEQLNQSLIPLFDLAGGAVLAYDNPVPEDRVLRRDTTIAFVNAGIRTRNEARGELGDEAYPDEAADQLYVGAQKLGAPPPAAPFGFGAPAAGGFTVQKGVADRRPALRRKAPADEPIRPDESEANIRRLADSLTGQLRLQLKLVIDRLAAGGGVTAEEVAKLLSGMDAGLAEKVAAHLRQALLRGAAAGLLEVPGYAGTFDVANPAVEAWLREYTPVLARSMTETSARAIQDIVAERTAAGASIRDIRVAIEASPSFSADGISHRAEMIARTESARAYVEGSIQGWEQAGIKGKIWLLAPDACEFCEATAAEFSSAIELRKSYYAQGETLTAGGKTMTFDYGSVLGPPLHPNCACTLVPQV